MATRMTALEKHESHKRRVRHRMIRTTARKLWQEDIRRTGRMGDGYDYATDPALHVIVDALLADPAVRHIDIPAKAFREYCNG